MERVEQGKEESQGRGSTVWVGQVQGANKTEDQAFSLASTYWTSI